MRDNGWIITKNVECTQANRCFIKIVCGKVQFIVL